MLIHISYERLPSCTTVFHCLYELIRPLLFQCWILDIVVIIGYHAETFVFFGPVQFSELRKDLHRFGKRGHTEESRILVL